MAHRDLHRFNRWARRLRPSLDATHHLRAGPAHDARTGRVTAGAACHENLTGVDAAIEMVKQARAATPGPNITFRQATAEDLPFAEDSFTMVFSTLTFHHWR